MRELDVKQVTTTIAQLCQDANFHLGEDVERALRNAEAAEDKPLAKEILGQLITNAEIAHQNQVPICQDTGMTIIFIEIGQEIHFVGGSLEEAIHEGVRQGYRSGYLRKSVVRHPLTRENTGDNTPAIIHIRVVPGDRLTITVAPKGFGSENMSGVGMLTPAQGEEGVKRFVVETVRRAGSNPCPPIIVGVGIGGSMEKAATLAKWALTREVGEHHSDPVAGRLEDELLQAINQLNIGPQGFGGKTTALWVSVELFPTHIASLPVAVNICCHANRHKSVML
ncbi:MAG: fumarate hydratase [Bacillota bacterium]